MKYFGAAHKFAYTRRKMATARALIPAPFNDAVRKNETPAMVYVDLQHFLLENRDSHMCGSICFLLEAEVHPGKKSRH